MEVYSCACRLSLSPATDCSHTATSMLLILVEVSMKVACLQPQSYYLFCLLKQLVCPQQPQSYYLHATYSIVQFILVAWLACRHRDTYSGGNNNNHP